MPSVKIHWLRGEIKALESEPFTRKEIRRAGYQFAKAAAMKAPRATGRGANSIRGSVDPDDPNKAIVSWGKKYYYMIWAEDGRKGHPGQHMLRRTYESYVHH